MCGEVYACEMSVGACRQAWSCALRTTRLGLTSDGWRYHLRPCERSRQEKRWNAGKWESMLINPMKRKVVQVLIVGARRREKLGESWASRGLLPAPLSDFGSSREPRGALPAVSCPESSACTRKTSMRAMAGNVKRPFSPKSTVL